MIKYDRKVVDLREIKRVGCAWKGCSESYDIDELPPGWRYLVIASGLLFEFENLFRADRDTALCPAHFQELDRLLEPFDKLTSGHLGITSHM